MALPVCLRASLLLPMLALSIGCATAEYVPEPDGETADAARDDADDTPPAEDVVATTDVPMSSDVPVPQVDVVTSTDAPPPRDIPASDVVTPRDVPAPMDVVTPMDVVAPMDVVTPRDVVASDVVVRPDVVVPTDNGLCITGTMRVCYTGPSTARGVGACREGVQTCAAGAWGACNGQVLPAPSETCGNGVDDDCNGMTDDGCTAPGTGPQISALAVGNVHACVTDAAQQTSCWGGNPRGQLASLAPTGSTRPTRASALDGVQLATNENYLCLRRADGSVACTGNNQYGTLGDATTTSRTAPVSVSGIRGASWITAGYYHACAVVSGGVRCWGRNESRQLGTTTSTVCSSSQCSTVPVTVPGITTAVQVVAGLSHTCALLRDGTVRCWGDNAYGQIGNGTTGAVDLGVTEVPGLSGVVQLASGHHHVCAVINDGTVRCWGSNTYGQFLDMGMARPSPTPIPGLTGVTQLALSVYHACARLTNGTLRCWGYNNYGQIGDGSTGTTRPLTTPTGLPAVADVAVGYWLTCARTASNNVWCWGWNLSGGVGDGTSGNTRATPVRIIP